MASKHEIKAYLAYWFQLGKKVVAVNGKASFLPKSILQGDKYSQEFEDCWQKILSPETGDCYLDGTIQTIAELLTPAWEMQSCGLCTMPIPIRSLGMPPPSCPCNDLENWPNTEVPLPRSPVSSQKQLLTICNSLNSSLS